MAIIEVVPNVSEGRRQNVLDALVDAVDRVTGVSLLDYSADPSHNRSVFTIVGEAEPLLRVLLALYEVATSEIDLSNHDGVHPRIGAIDVVPFVPIRAASMSDCVTLARRLGRAVADRFAVPIFLYEEAATRPERRRLEEIRRGQFEGLTAKMQRDIWQPDFGPAEPHPTAGASAIGARGLLIAFNVNLATDDLDAGRAVASAIRERNGGLRCVKAIAVRLARRDIVQVSINLTDYTQTPLHKVVAAVEREASTRGVAILNTEVVGLLPLDVVVATNRHVLRLQHFTRHQVLEAQLIEKPLLPREPPSGAS